uniref:UBP34/UBP24/USP9X/USP9Y-like ARM repeat region domain-containing protein n=1 Tax=Amphimedon queenslandica TaxID=400682 RepID=A0A1X7TIL3_AMPQE
LDHLFGCFQKSWVGASKKQRDELLDFIRHLAEDDKEGIMASKVLDLKKSDCLKDFTSHFKTIQNLGNVGARANK